MPTVQDILRLKGDALYTIPAHVSVLDATHVMNQHKIGALVVMDVDRVAGMLTERDVLQRIVAAEKPAATTLVGDVMTRDVICCSPNDDLDDVSAIMKVRRVRHVPVCGCDGQLLGMISIGDVNAQYASHAEQHVQFLNDYIYGRA